MQELSKIMIAKEQKHSFIWYSEMVVLHQHFFYFDKAFLFFNIVILSTG